MKTRHGSGLLLFTAALGAALLIPSCAYLQTHKNIAEIGTEYEGLQYRAPKQIYNKDGIWYTSAEKVKFTKKYPVINDHIFLTQFSKAPTYTVITNPDDQETVYVPISSATAQVLQQEHGYFTNRVLMQEVKRNQNRGLNRGVGMVAHPVKATVEGEPEPIVFEETRQPKKASFMLRALSAADMVLVDGTGTVLYNVAIPVMAPFVFFHQFLTEE